MLDHGGRLRKKTWRSRATLGTYLNWRTPSSLFPPSAIISLTDDNSTFFLARPAAFGPVLPVKSLSGQLWIGSGFGDDHLGRGSAGRLEGELGCSDMPGWSDRDYTGTSKSLNDAKSSWADGQRSDSLKKRKRDVAYEGEDDEEASQEPPESDGTDDHLHHPLPPSDGLKTNGEKKPTHADIQSLQESAEIAGKIVLLSRGGCGFVEKAKWVQRRGGVALIVGDDVRGGPLVTMYARGDTSNVTIPSLFTSHTTAHLLSSLIPSGNVEGISPEEAERLGRALETSKTNLSLEEIKNNNSADKPNFTTTTIAVKSTQSAKAQLKHNNDYSGSARNSREDVNDDAVGWFGSLFGGSGRNTQDSRRPPSSGNIGWVLQEEFEDEEAARFGRIAKQSTTTTTATLPTVTPDRSSGDGFVIGVQDWRDPDLVAQAKEQLHASSRSTIAGAQNSKAPTPDGLKGDSITPGSGEYAKAAQGVTEASNAQNPGREDSSQHKQNNEKK